MPSRVDVRRVEERDAAIDRDLEDAPRLVVGRGHALHPGLRLAERHAAEREDRHLEAAAAERAVFHARQDTDSRTVIALERLAIAALAEEAEDAEAASRKATDESAELAESTEDPEALGGQERPSFMLEWPRGRAATRPRALQEPAQQARDRGRERSRLGRRSEAGRGAHCLLEGRGRHDRRCELHELGRPHGRPGASALTEVVKGMKVDQAMSLDLMTVAEKLESQANPGIAVSRTMRSGTRSPRCEASPLRSRGGRSVTASTCPRNGSGAT